VGEAVATAGTAFAEVRQVQGGSQIDRGFARDHGGQIFFDCCFCSGDQHGGEQGPSLPPMDYQKYFPQASTHTKRHGSRRRRHKQDKHVFVQCCRVPTCGETKVTARSRQPTCPKMISSYLLNECSCFFVICRGDLRVISSRVRPDAPALRCVAWVGFGQRSA